MTDLAIPVERLRWPDEVPPFMLMVREAPAAKIDSRRRRDGE